MAACSSGEHRLRLKQLSTFFRCPKSQITSVSACLCVCQRLTMEFHKDSPTSVALASSTNAWRRSTASPSSRTPAVSPASSSPPTKSATCKCNPPPPPPPPPLPPPHPPHRHLHSIHMIPLTDVLLGLLAGWDRCTTVHRHRATWEDPERSVAAGRTVTS